MAKIKSVLELARYKPGDQAWVVTFENNGKPIKKLRVTGQVNNKLQSIIRSEIRIKKILISAVQRLNGEYQYVDAHGRLYDDLALCDSEEYARNVRRSIGKLISEWAISYI